MLLLNLLMRQAIVTSESRLIESPTPGIISRCSMYEPFKQGLFERPHIQASGVHSGRQNDRPTKNV
jgi:hypothetical protein